MALTMSLSQAVPTKLSNVAISSTAAAAASSSSSSSSSGSSARVSAPSLLLTRSMWGTKLALKAAPVGYTTQRVSASPVAILLEDEEEESAEEITAAYEALYGKAFGGLKQSESNEDEEEEGQGRGRRGRAGGDDFERGGRRDRGGKEFEERVVQIRRVTKVVKGGKQLSFRAVVVIGDKRGKVGVGVGKAKEVIAAVQKSATDARRHLVTVPMTKYLTFPHRADGQYGAAKVMLRPAATGTGVIAGGSVRVVLELAGVENALGKELGSKNPLNNARAVVEAVSKMKQFKDVARDRGIPMEELWK